VASGPQLGIKQIAESQQTGYRLNRMFNDGHAATKMLIQHPLGNNQLITAWKNDLHLMRTE